MQLRDQLGRAMVAQPDSPTLQRANMLMQAVFARQSELPSVVKLGAARATALALDLARARTLSAGDTMPLLSDYLDPSRVPALSWAQRAQVGDLVNTRTGQPIALDPLANLQGMIDRAMQSLKDAPGQAALDVANALDAAYRAVAESAKNVGRGAAEAVDAAARSAVLPVVLVGGLLLAVGFARRRSA